ncbi:hypothetical protein ACFSKU_11470 [Pontibacter silvestris]|uniref:DKNYY family protein n=1 Tax=Pontibacter silvestris TaxID=2305183 RepID=A0ABW4WXN3_9BACT|nr:hypothetical protein [Pontibacter silvestris]MCC9135364.1 hypothetical protein [Pontibacter silvestris]
MILTYNNRYEGVKGTPYFVDDWHKGTLGFKNTIYDQVEVKYNVYENRVLYRGTDGKEFFLEPHQIDYFTIDSFTFKKPENLKGLDVKLMNSFFAVLHEGKKCQLLMLPEKTFIKANYQGGYSAGNTYDELQTAKRYYFVDHNNEAQKIKLNKKSLLQVLHNKNPEVES